MWMLIGLIAVIVLLALYLNRRGTPGVPGNVRTSAETLSWLEGRYGDKRER